MVGFVVIAPRHTKARMPIVAIALCLLSMTGSCGPAADDPTSTAAGEGPPSAAAGGGPGRAAADAPAAGIDSSLSYEMRLFERNETGCGEGGADDCLTLRFDWPEVVDASSPAAAAAINEPIRAWLRRSVFEDGGGEPEAIWEGFLLTRSQLREEFPDYRNPWWVRRSATVLRDAEGVFAVGMYEDLYTGGAHGIHTMLYLNFRPAGGVKIELSDILIAGGLADLTIIGEQIFRQHMGIGPGDDLEEAGFWFDDSAFALNDNFLIDTDSLRFYFNEYEIAAYAQGPTELEIPYASIEHLLRPGAPVR